MKGAWEGALGTARTLFVLCTCPLDTIGAVVARDLTGITRSSSHVVTEQQRNTKV